MNNLIKNYVKATLIILGLLFIFSIIFNILYYYDILNNNSLKYFKMLVSIISFFIGGIFIGKKSLNKGYINGLKLSLIIVIIFVTIGIIFNNINFTRIFYYLIMSTCITFGAMIGINKKES